MKRIVLTLPTALLLTFGTAIAQPPERGEQPSAELEARVKRMFSHDENKDGKLTKEEVPERLQSAFARGDKNEDGVLTADEVRAYLQGRERGADGDRPRGPRDGERREGDRPRDGDRPSREGDGPPRDGEGRGRGPGPGGMPLFPLMKALDADSDGEISADEMKNAAVALAKLDRNKDGKLDHTELRPDFGGRGRGEGEGGRPDFGNPEQMVRSMLERHDANKDGKLSGDEIPERMRENLARIDTNGDDVVDKAELEQMGRNLGGRGGEGRPGGRGGERGRGDGERGRDGGGDRRRPAEE